MTYIFQLLVTFCFVPVIFTTANSFPRLAKTIDWSIPVADCARVTRPAASAPQTRLCSFSSHTSFTYPNPPISSMPIAALGVDIRQTSSNRVRFIRYPKIRWSLSRRVGVARPRPPGRCASGPLSIRDSHPAFVTDADSQLRS